MAGPGNQSALKHGAEAGIKRLADGRPFTGLAVKAQADVEARLERDGLEAIVTQDAIRAQAVLELFWTAVVAAADAGDLAKLDAYTARWGWLCGVTLRAWAQVKQDRKGKGGRLSEVLEAYRQQDTVTIPTQDSTGSQQDAPRTAQTDQVVQDDQEANE